MELQLVPLDNETGEVLRLNPEMLKKFDNSTLTNLLSATKGIDKLKKKLKKKSRNALMKVNYFHDSLIQKNTTQEYLQWITLLKWL